TPLPAPGSATSVTATAAGRASATVSWSAPTTGGPVTSYTITPYVGATAQTPTTVSGSPPDTTATVSGLTNGTTYAFRVTATNGAGTSPAAGSNAVTPQATIFDLAAPDVADSGDTTAVELGVKFTADYDGSILGIRFYKAAANRGT